jgi:hypothetical protein
MHELTLRFKSACALLLSLKETFSKDREREREEQRTPRANYSPCRVCKTYGCTFSRKAPLTLRKKIFEVLKDTTGKADLGVLHARMELGVGLLQRTFKSLSLST